MPAIPTARTLQAARRRADRRRDGVATVLAQMRGGPALHLHLDTRSGETWWLSDGRSVSSDVARLVVAHVDVAPVGDALFRNTPSQTFRHI
jgi:hypothetical protein